MQREFRNKKIKTESFDFDGGKRQNLQQTKKYKRF